MSSLAMPDALATAMRGTLTAPGDEDYDERRALYNAMIDRRPALIARCTDAADVMAAIGHARREKLPVHIRLMDGTDLEGRVKNFDRFAVIVEHSGADHMVFKHAIATIRSPRTMGNYYSTHEA